MVGSHQAAFDERSRTLVEQAVHISSDLCPTYTNLIHPLQCKEITSATHKALESVGTHITGGLLSTIEPTVADFKVYFLYQIFTPETNSLCRHKCRLPLGRARRSKRNRRAIYRVIWYVRILSLTQHFLLLHGPVGTRASGGEECCLFNSGGIRQSCIPTCESELYT